MYHFLQFIQFQLWNTHIIYPATFNGTQLLKSELPVVCHVHCLTVPTQASLRRISSLAARARARGVRVGKGKGYNHVRAANAMPSQNGAYDWDLASLTKTTPC